MNLHEDPTRVTIPFISVIKKHSLLLPVMVEAPDDVTTFDTLVFSSRFQTSSSSPSGSLSPMTTKGCVLSDCLSNNAFLLNG